MFRRVIPAIAGATVVALVAAGCASESDDSVFTGDEGADEEARTPDSPEAVAQAAVQDVEAYWEATFPELYGSSLPPLQNGWDSYSPDDPPPPCGDFSLTYEELADNAFYCQFDDYIAYDEAGLLPWLWDEFGGFTIAMVMAHEFGHAVQYRVDELPEYADAPVEMQADCYAGAWTGWIAEGNSANFDVSVASLDQPIAGLIAFRDPPGTRPDDFGAHGAGFDRVYAFQEGFEQGAQRCAEYPELARSGDLTITQMPFTSPEEFQTGGNLQLEDLGPDVEDQGLYSLAEGNLEVFYEWLFDNELGEQWTPVGGLEAIDPATDQVTCNGETLSGEDELTSRSDYCVDENVVIIDGATLAPDLHSKIGDFAVAAEIARLWAVSAQNQLGIEESKEARLQADCLNGAWSADMWPGSGGEVGEGMQGRLSAGDLDEVVMGFIVYSQDRRDRFGTVFERTAAFRDGFHEGIPACEEILPLN